jgi:oligoendopeptidase F
LNDLYSGPDDPGLEKDFLQAEKSSHEFIKKYARSVRKLSGYELYRAIVDYEKIIELLVKIKSFALLRYLEDTGGESSVLFLRQTGERVDGILSELAFFKSEINTLSDAEIGKMLVYSSNLREHYGVLIAKLRLLRDHQLSNDLEYFVREEGFAGGSPTTMDEAGSRANDNAWVRLFEVLMNRISFRVDKNKYLTGEQMVKYLESYWIGSSDRVRMTKSYNQTLGGSVDLFAHIMNALVQEKIISDRLRKFEKPMSHSNLLEGLNDRVVENLHSVFQKNYGAIVHRYYYTLKTKLLSGNRLQRNDLFSEIEFDYHWRYSWQEAINAVIYAYEKFLPELADVYPEFLSGGWIYATADKRRRSGSVYYPINSGTHPYLLVNFESSDAGVLALAHGFGHIIHLHLSRNNSYLNLRAPSTIAEAVSIFGENLVFDHLKDDMADDIDKKIVLIMHRIEYLTRNMIRDVALIEFENNFYEERKHGELTTDRISEIWEAAWKKSLGDIFGSDDDHKYWWAGEQQLFRYPFYGYSHILAECLANILYSRYKKNPENFREKYLKLLSSGGNGHYSDLLVPFNIDLENENLWQEGFDVITELIDELDILLKIRDCSP